MKCLLLILCVIAVTACKRQKSAVVFQSDFGLKDGAVSAMKGVAASEDPDLKLYDLTHEIPPFNIWEAAYRLEQTAAFWPVGTVFVSVVDPGVGTVRKSIVMRSVSGHYFVTPDNGTLTLVAKSLGIESVREIDESLNRRRNSTTSYTFHGRDVYAFTGARLASGKISFEEVGSRLPDSVVTIRFEEARLSGDSIIGGIPVLDPEYGNVWTNIPDSLLKQMNIGNASRISVTISEGAKQRFSKTIPYLRTFGEVPVDSILAYSNSLLNLSFGINQGNFAATYGVASGSEWKVVVTCIPSCK
jgi:S-adenosylmethionine hydrolase